MSDKPRISLIGPGTVGLTLTRFLQNKGYPIVSVVGETPASADKVERFLGHVPFSTELKDSVQDSEIVLVTVSDPAIGKVSGELSLLPVQNKHFYHTSGIKTYHEFDGLREKGAETGAIHPLQSFVHVEESIQSLPGTYYCIEGTPAAVEKAKHLVNDLEGECISVNPELKTLYHAAACISANYLLSVLRIGEVFFKKSGLDQESVIPAMLAMIKGILRNVQNRGIIDSITGPIARGDRDTLQQQLQIVRKHMPQYLPIFRALSLQCASILFEKEHANPDQIDNIMWVLEQNLLEDSTPSDKDAH